MRRDARNRRSFAPATDACTLPARIAPGAVPSPVEVPTTNIYVHGLIDKNKGLDPRYTPPPPSVGG